MKLRNIFQKKENNLERDIRELLRENLNVLNTDVFYQEDPVMKMTKEERLLYLKEFADIYKNKIFIDRLRFMISKQAQKTLWNSGTGIQDIAGSMQINAISSVIDEVKESVVPDENPLDKFSIIPTIHAM